MKIALSFSEVSVGSGWKAPSGALSFDIGYQRVLTDRARADSLSQTNDVHLIEVKADSGCQRSDEHPRPEAPSPTRRNIELELHCPHEAARRQRWFHIIEDADTAQYLVDSLRSIDFGLGPPTSPVVGRQQDSEG